ncbi:MAG TPA: CorA family divalent cation transporter [Pseudolabrys sp.]|jgi:zinc transporter|uniref:CorA family divalent cation transporter n=1 Tax=Pseudolabrys sp. TaxID=1960880 RepID=UPI002DDDB9D6|nr:CorA family divalent cation transporter [Pseudolabrys sp.]HEV2631245.1 CorA family divalent cation transporter [Pseudolabrys sp.]
MSTADLADAAPATGIVWAYRFAPDGSAAALRPAEIDVSLASHEPGWVWVHLALADARCRSWIVQHAPVSDSARELLAGSDQHVRLDVLGHEIVGVVPDLQQELGEHTDALVRLRFVLTERMLITARQRPVHSVETTRRALEGGKRFPNAVSFLDGIIDQFADAVARMAERLGDELDRAEDRVLDEEPADERVRLGRVRIQAVRVHRQLGQLRSLFHRVESRIAAENAAVGRAVRRLAQKLDSIDHEIGSLHERARLLLDELDAKTAAIANRRLFTLSILTACLLPPTLVTGFFGMNTKDLPFQNTDGGTWLALLVAFASGAISYWALRRMRAF